MDSHLPSIFLSSSERELLMNCSSVGKADLNEWPCKSFKAVSFIVFLKVSLTALLMSLTRLDWMIGFPLKSMSQGEKDC